MTVTEVHCGNGSHFLKLVDRDDEFWLDLERPKANSVAGAGEQDRVALAIPYSTEFQQFPLVATPSNLESIRPVMDKWHVVELDKLTGGTFDENSIGSLGGETGELHLGSVGAASR